MTRGSTRGLDFTKVFRGWLSADGGALAGDWVDVPRGGTANSGTLVADVWQDADGFRLVRVDDQTTGGFGWRVWRPTGSLLEAQDIADDAGRVQRYDVKLGHNNPPCRDFTVMWGGVWQPMGPRLPPPSLIFPLDYCSFVGFELTAAGLQYLGWKGDGDFDFDFTPLCDTDFPNGTNQDDFWSNGVVTEQPSEFPEKPVDLIGSQFQQFQRFHCEAAMYGRENSGWPDCFYPPRKSPARVERAIRVECPDQRPPGRRPAHRRQSSRRGEQVPQLRGRTRRADGRPACQHHRESVRRRRRRRRTRQHKPARDPSRLRDRHAPELHDAPRAAGDPQRRLARVRQRHLLSTPDRPRGVVARPDTRPGPVVRQRLPRNHPPHRGRKRTVD